MSLIGMRKKGFWIKGLIKWESLHEIFVKVFLFLRPNSESFENQIFIHLKTTFSTFYIFYPKTNDFLNRIF